MNIPDHISESFETVSWVKDTFNQGCGSGSGSGLDPYSIGSVDPDPDP